LELELLDIPRKLNLYCENESNDAKRDFPTHFVKEERQVNTSKIIMHVIQKQH